MESDCTRVKGPNTDKICFAGYRQSGEWFQLYWIGFGGSFKFYVFGLIAADND